MKIGSIIQARTSSTRLPKKVLKELPYESGITVLEQVIRRLKNSNRIDEIIVATTKDKEDEEIVKIAKKERVNIFRGSKENVLERFYLAAKKNDLDIIVRVTSDCPCIDPEIVDLTLKEHLKTNADFTSNALSKTFPRGLDIEILNFETLEKTFIEAKSNFEREHVSPYVYKTNPNSFKINVLRANKDFFGPNIRITLDTEEDYALLCTVFDYLYYRDEYFNIKDILKLFDSKPWLKLINRKIIQKKIFDNLEDEIRASIELLETQELKRAKRILEDFLK